MSREYVLKFPRLDGGLNLKELSYRMDSDLDFLFCGKK